MIAPDQPPADAPSAAIPELVVASALTLGLLTALGTVAVLFTLLGVGGGEPGEALCAASADARTAIPADYLTLYQHAGASFGLDWSVLAAIGYVESGHGVNLGPSSAGALGPMQFLRGTWVGYGVDGDGDGRRDVMDPADAIPGAAKLLRATGAPANWPRAIFAYNHADWYVQEVLAQAERYRGACTSVPIGTGGELAWPVVGAVTSPFCERRAWERCHPGIDIAVPSGTPVRAAAAGTVTLAAPVSGYGNLVCITHSAQLTTCYAHLGEYSTIRGAQVRMGDVVALSDCTGRCFGAHLHFEVRRGRRFGAPVTDPMPYLGEAP
jgi:peptidoglycan LD-endopeptidase LytH